MPKPVLSVQGFNKLVLDAIDESLLSLGQASRDALIGYLNSSFGLNKWETLTQADAIEALFKSLRRIFGEAASPLEKLIAINLRKKMQPVSILSRIDS